MAQYSVHGSSMIQKAFAFAYGAHGAIDQRRKYTNEPYIVHPKAVAELVQSVATHIWQQVVVAWLHDTVEDTAITLRDIEEMFGGDIAMGVMHLTNVGHEMGNRAKRFELNLTRLMNAPDWVKTVKVADLIDNTRTIVENDPQFAVLYLREKAVTLEAIKGADADLWQRAWQQLEKERASLKVPA
jgi:(p)ppGpp synthase/HD superfamily hydrolase